MSVNASQSSTGHEGELRCVWTHSSCRLGSCSHTDVGREVMRAPVMVLKAQESHVRRSLSREHKPSGFTASNGFRCSNVSLF